MTAITNSVTVHKTYTHWFVLTISYQRRCSRALAFSSNGIKVVCAEFPRILADGLNFLGFRLNPVHKTQLSFQKYVTTLILLQRKLRHCFGLRHNVRNNFREKVPMRHGEYTGFK
jgi:hypothetical protein